MEEIKSVLGMENTNSIFSILKQEHNQVKSNLRQMMSESTQRMDIFNQTRDALNSHMRGEEAVLYPRLESVVNMRPIALASIEEHNLARQVIDQIPGSSNMDQWIAKIRVLNDLISKHVDVEENEVFPQARNFMNDEQQESLGREYTSKTRV